ncbi:hypothetical protein [Streptomyces sp. NPDC059788]|uniref:hypothetical protein n=1 Tax=Streptomyces sp. NPDC059788 TaxID=3346948 RepID=UPI00365A1A1C
MPDHIRIPSPPPATGVTRRTFNVFGPPRPCANLPNTDAMNGVSMRLTSSPAPPRHENDSASAADRIVVMANTVIDVIDAFVAAETNPRFRTAIGESLRDLPDARLPRPILYRPFSRPHPYGGGRAARRRAAACGRLPGPASRPTDITDQETR